MRISWANCKKLKGTVIAPPDKSITHRALILGSITKRGLVIKNPLFCGDTFSTLRCLLRLGKKIKIKDQEVVIEKGELLESRNVLYCGNSGTTARLLSGLLCAQNFFSVLDGDRSLKRRPMRRIVEPLRKMGAIIHGREEDTLLPLAIKGGELKGINFEMDIPSAQVKSAILISSLFAEGETVIKEKIRTRDHTERMVKWLDGDIEVKNGIIIVNGFSKLQGKEILVPGDFSSASFFITGAIIVKDSHIFVRNVGLNPTRTGFLRVLERMGAEVKILDLKTQCNEEVGDLEVKYSPLKGVEVSKDEIPSLIDEIPLIALLATQAEGITRITGAKELRYKESDRIRAVCKSLKRMGAKIEELEDGFIVEGTSSLKGTYLTSCGDHRIAMTLCIASLIAEGETFVKGLKWVEISYPNFTEALYSLCSE